MQNDEAEQWSAIATSRGEGNQVSFVLLILRPGDILKWVPRSALSNYGVADGDHIDNLPDWSEGRQYGIEWVPSHIKERELKRLLPWLRGVITVTTVKGKDVYFVRVGAKEFVGTFEKIIEDVKGEFPEPENNAGRRPKPFGGSLGG